MASQRDLRLRAQHFPGAEELVFTTDRRGFAPVPIILRKLIRHLHPPEFRVYLYLCLRASKHGICFPSYDEMIYELGLTSKKNLEPHLNALVEKQCISRSSTGGTHYFLVHDPRIPIQRLVAMGKVGKHELAAINGLLADLNQEPIKADALFPPMIQFPAEEVQGFGIKPSVSRQEVDAAVAAYKNSQLIAEA